MKALYGSLNENDRRRYAAIEANKLGCGGQTWQIRQKGACPSCPDSTPEIAAAFVDVVDVYAARNPTQDDVRWTYLSRPEIAACLCEEGFAVSVTVVDPLFEEFHMVYRPPQKIKTVRADPDCDAQLKHIAQLNRLWEESGEPTPSKGVKQREMLGDYARPGNVLATARLRASDHAFRTRSLGVIIPRGLYDLALNEGYEGTTPARGGRDRPVVRVAHYTRG